MPAGAASTPPLSPAATDGFVRAYGSDFPLLKAARGAVVAAMNRSRPLKRAMILNACGLLGDPAKAAAGDAAVR